MGADKGTGREKFGSYGSPSIGRATNRSSCGTKERESHDPDVVACG